MYSWSCLVPVDQYVRWTNIAAYISLSRTIKWFGQCLVVLLCIPAAAQVTVCCFGYVFHCFTYLARPLPNEVMQCDVRWVAPKAACPSLVDNRLPRSPVISTFVCLTKDSIKWCDVARLDCTYCWVIVNLLTKLRVQLHFVISQHCLASFWDKWTSNSHET